LTKKNQFHWQVQYDLVRISDNSLRGLLFGATLWSVSSSLQRSADDEACQRHLSNLCLYLSDDTIFLPYTRLTNRPRRPTHGTWPETDITSLVGTGLWRNVVRHTW